MAKTLSHRSVTSLEALEARIAPAMIYGIDTQGNLLAFDSSDPGTVITKAISGLGNALEKIRGIDFRPANGQLYALSILDPGAAENSAFLYTLDFKALMDPNQPTVPALAVSGLAFATNLQDGNDYSFDINPAADLIRITSDRDDNLRVSPTTGGLVATDTAISPNTTALVGVAYDHNYFGADTTTLYGIDLTTDSLVKIGGTNGVPSPNGGVITTVGPLGLDLGGNYKVGFDIESRTDLGYAVLRPNGGVTSLYAIDPLVGSAFLLGPVAGNPLLDGISVALPNDLMIVNATTATYLDQDGDLVTIRATGTKPGAAFAPEDFTFATGQFGSQLKLLNLSDANNGQEWAKANLTITAVVKNGLGDSFTNVGYINAFGVDLGKVSLNGDLGRIDAGDGDAATPGLASLAVHSLGTVGNSQLPALLTNQTSNIVGKLGSLTVKTDLTRALVSVTGGTVNGSIGPVSIGGDFIGGSLFSSAGVAAEGSISSLILKGSLFGGDFSGNGAITANQLGNVTVGGSIYGGTAANTGRIFSTTSLGTVKVGGSIYGGGGSRAGGIETQGTMGNVTLKGSLVGGMDDHTGTIFADDGMGNVTIGGSIVGGIVANANDLDSGLLYAFGNMGSVKVNGDLVGSNGDYSGGIYAEGTLKSVAVLGSLRGSSGDYSGSVAAGANLGAVKIGVDVLGGAGDFSGSIYTFNTGSIASVTITGSLAGANSQAGILAVNNLGAVKIGGEVRGATVGSVRISAGGTADMVGGIASISVAGSVKNALFAAGYTINGDIGSPDASIGAVKVGGNFIATSIAAGIAKGADGFFGSADDLKINDNADAIIAKIASVTVKGYAVGTVSLADSFGIVAEQVGAVKVGLRTYTLAAGTDTTGFRIGGPDILVREF